MYITVTRTGKDKKNAYVKLMEAYRDADGKKKTRVVKNYGRLDAMLAEDPQALDKLKKQYQDERDAKKRAIAEERIADVQRIIAMSNKPESGSKQNIPNPSLRYGHYALRSIWDKDLDLGQMLESLQKTAAPDAGFSIGDAAFFMAGVTAMDPDSSLGGGYSYTDYTGLDILGCPLRDISLDNMYAALSFLKDSRDSILDWCKKKLDEKFCRDRALALVLFKVPVKAPAPHTAIAMLLDEKGFPADYELFSGGAGKSSSLKAAIEKLKERNKTEACAVVFADSSLNKAACLKTLQAMDPGFYMAGDGNADDKDTGLSTMQQAFVRENLRLLKKSFEHCPASLTDAQSQGHILVCILAQLLLQLLCCRLDQQGTNIKLKEICSNLFAATVTAVYFADTLLMFLLTAGMTGKGITYSPHMPDIMKACDLTPLVRINTLAQLAKALGTSFASPADACPLLSADFLV